MGGLKSTLAAVLVAAVTFGATEGQAATAQSADTVKTSGVPTLGGRQFWGDVKAHAKWRIQENVLTGHFRLLDPSNKRVTWGTYEECAEHLENVSQAHSLQWQSKHLVVMLHGLARTKTSFRKLQQTLDGAGYATLRVSYPSTRGSASDHAAKLNSLIERLEGIDTISFVTHSFGGLVLRQTLSSASWRNRIAVNAGILLAPPNQGSEIADFLKDFGPYKLIGGRGGQAVTSEAAQALSTPATPFGVIAGGRGDDKGFNPLLEGDDDGVVRVEEARLDGASDFMVVDAIHTFIMDHPDAVEAIKNFLKVGRFDAAHGEETSLK